MVLLGTKILIGLVVGVLVGLTGLGGGVLLLPLLIFVVGLPPILAVGSDAAINFVTKIGAGYLHYRQGTVNRRVVKALVLGSAPGAICGVALLAYVRAMYGSGVNEFLKVAVGILLISIPTLLFVKRELSRRLPTLETLPAPGSYSGMTVIGFVAGLLVGMTSVGSGSIVMVLLLIFYGLPPGLMVGTDIVHAVMLTGITSLLHFRLGTIDPMVVASILVGSVPGALLGTRLSTRIPVFWLKRVLCALLFITGARMLLI